MFLFWAQEDYVRVVWRWEFTRHEILMPWTTVLPSNTCNWMLLDICWVTCHQHGVAVIFHDWRIIVFEQCSALSSWAIVGLRVLLRINCALNIGIAHHIHQLPIQLTSCFVNAFTKLLFSSTYMKHENIVSVSPDCRHI